MTQPYPQGNGPQPWQQQNAPQPYPQQQQQQFQQPMQQPTPGVDLALSQPKYGINAVEAIVRFFKKYATFSGRASRSEYWWMFMWSYVLYFVIGALTRFSEGTGFSQLFNGLSGLVSLGILVPMLALTIRRYHDSGRAGTWFLASVIPMVLGYIILIIALVFLGLSAGTSSGYSDYGYSDSTSTVWMAATHTTRSYGFTGLQGAALIWILLSLVLILGGVIVNLVFTLQGSKLEGVRFDKPRLPLNQTVLSADVTADLQARQNASYQAASQQAAQGAPQNTAQYGYQQPAQQYAQPQAQAQAQASAQQAQTQAPAQTSQYGQYGQTAPAAPVSPATPVATKPATPAHSAPIAPVATPAPTAAQQAASQPSTPAAAPNPFTTPVSEQTPAAPEANEPSEHDADSDASAE
jgi:uncharacterized membrane protein YhaH (DUF805 family)